jgi:hypothetical protein
MPSGVQSIEFIDCPCLGPIGQWSLALLPHFHPTLPSIYWHPKGIPLYNYIWFIICVYIWYWFALLGQFI